MDKNDSTDEICFLFGVTAVIACTENFDEIEEQNIGPNIVTDQCCDKNDTQCNEQQNTLSVKAFVKDKAIEMYARKGLENVKKTLKNSEPLVIGSIDKEKIKENDMDIVFQLKNVKLYNAGSFQVKKFKSISDQGAAEFSVEVPSIRANCNYEVSGTFRGKKVNGKGNADVNITGISIDNARIVVKETPQEIQIQSLDICYDFKDMSIKQTGLNIEGLEPNEVTNFLNDSGKKYLKNNRKKICDRVSTEFKKRANAKMKGKNRDQLMEMMKKT